MAGCLAVKTMLGGDEKKVAMARGRARLEGERGPWGSGNGRVSLTGKRQVLTKSRAHVSGAQCVARCGRYGGGCVCVAGGGTGRRMGRPWLRGDGGGGDDEGEERRGLGR